MLSLVLRLFGSSQLKRIVYTILYIQCRVIMKYGQPFLGTIRRGKDWSEALGFSDSLVNHMEAVRTQENAAHHPNGG